MDHVSAEHLAGHALGLSDDLTSADLTHLAGCASCRFELDALVGTADAVRRGSGQARPLPGSQVWQRIAAEVGADKAGAPLTLVSNSARNRLDASPVDSRRPRPRRAKTSASRRGMVLVAAAVGLILGAGGVVAANRFSDREVVLASTSLAPLPGQTGRGTAELVRTGGTVELRVTVEASAPGDDFRELWLLNTDGKRMYAIGVLPASGTDSYPVPAQLDRTLQGFTIVDVSIEPYDGNALHSGHSLVRGTLPT